jgi:hypothetical protein
VKHAEWVNILEHVLDGQEGQVALSQDKDAIVVKLDFRAFEIKTLKLVLS